MCKIKNRTLDFLIVSCYIFLEKYRKAAAYLTEDEKIQRVIKKNEGFFQNTISDVAQTKKGVWIFFEYDEEHSYYNCFFRFKTAKELEWIIAEVLADEMNILIETTAENIHHELEDVDINDVACGCYDISIPELMKNMEVLNNELQKGAQKMDAIFRAMPSVFRGLKGEPSSRDGLVSD